MGEQKRFLGSAPKVVSNYNDENRHCTRAVILHSEGLTEGDPGLTPAKFQTRISFAPLQETPASIGFPEEWPLPALDAGDWIIAPQHFTPLLFVRHALTQCFAIERELILLNCLHCVLSLLGHDCDHCVKVWKNVPMFPQWLLSMSCVKMTSAQEMARLSVIRFLYLNLLLSTNSQKFVSSLDNVQNPLIPWISKPWQNLLTAWFSKTKKAV